MNRACGAQPGKDEDFLHLAVGRQWKVALGADRQLLEANFVASFREGVARGHPGF
jgi:hypothetical protein